MARIKPLRSYTSGAVPTTSDLEANELAINWADGKAYTKTVAGNIVSVTLGGSGSASIVSATTAAGFPATGSVGTLYHATDSRRIFFWDASGVYVEAGTSGGTGEDSTLRSLFIPSAPTSVSATGGNAQATVSWTAPSVLAQTPITDYTVQFSSNSGSSWTTFTRAASATASAVVTSLTNGTAYVFRVAAVNGVGTGAYSTASAAVTPSAGTTATLTSGGGANSWRWSPAFGSGSDVTVGRWDDGSNVQSGWRTTFTPASKPSSIASATFALPYTWGTGATAFSAVLRGAKLANAGQGLQGTSPTTASATGSVTASNGTLTIDCTAVVAEIIGQSGWNPGNSIVLYLSGENASTDRMIDAADTAGSLVITYA